MIKDPKIANIRDTVQKQTNKTIWSRPFQESLIPAPEISTLVSFLVDYFHF